MFRLALPFYAVAIAVSLVTMGLGNLGPYLLGDTEDPGIFLSLVGVLALILYFLLYMVTIASSSLITYIPHFHFYKHLFSDEGYLTMTLPVKMSDHLLSKTISAFVVSAIGVFVSLVSIVLTMSPIYSGELSLTDFLDLFEILFGSVGGNVVAFAIEMVVMMIVAAFSSVTMIFLSITLGAIIFKRHKIIGAIVCYFMVSGILGILEVILVFIFSLIAGFVAAIGENLIASTHIVFILLIFGFVAIGLGCYFVTLHLFKNKLNLE